MATAQRSSSFAAPGGNGVSSPIKPGEAEVSGRRVRARVLRTIPEVEAARAFWMRMQQHPNSDIDVFLQVMDSLAGRARPHVVVLYRQGAPEAILVGRLESARLSLKIGYAGILRPKARTLTFIYAGLLGNTCPGNCSVLAEEVMRSLKEGEADVAFFNHLRQDSPLCGFLAGAASFWSRDYFPTIQTHRSLVLPASAEEFWQRLSPKVRKNQRRQARQMLNDYPGSVQVRCFRDSSEFDEMIRDVEAVAQKTYQRGLGVGFAADPPARGRLLLRATRGWLRTYVLYIAGKPCAFWCGTAYAGVFHSDFMGYDPEHSRYSPGIYLVIRVIEEFCAAGRTKDIEAVDFGLGDAQYKEILGNMDWQDSSTYVFAPTARGLALNAIRTPLMLVDMVSRTALERANILARIKKIWRNLVAGQPSSKTCVPRPIAKAVAPDNGARDPLNVQ